MAVLIRQDIMGYPRSFHVLVAEPRFLLVKDHAATGVIQFCVCHGPYSTHNKLKFRRDGVVPPHSSGALVRILYHSSRYARVGSVASLAVGDQVADREDTVGAEFHAMLLEWDFCLPATLPGPDNDLAKLSGTWCSRTRWHRIDFVVVLRDWFAGVKQAQDGCGASRKWVL